MPTSTPRYCRDSALVLLEWRAVAVLKKSMCAAAATTSTLWPLRLCVCERGVLCKKRMSKEGE